MSLISFEATIFLKKKFVFSANHTILFVGQPEHDKASLGSQQRSALNSF